MGKPGPKHVAYPVHGRLMTRREVAEAFGRSSENIYQWQNRHRHPDGTLATMQETWDRYEAVRLGLEPVRPGRPPAAHEVDGQRLTLAEMAEACGTTVTSFCNGMKYHGHGPAEEYRRRRKKREARETRRAVSEILAVCLEAMQHDT